MFIYLKSQKLSQLRQKFFTYTTYSIFLDHLHICFYQRFLWLNTFKTALNFQKLIFILIIWLCCSGIWEEVRWWRRWPLVVVDVMWLPFFLRKLLRLPVPFLHKLKYGVTIFRTALLFPKLFCYKSF